jgi:RNA polymerase sigma-70 factor (ECF subfamily)
MINTSLRPGSAAVAVPAQATAQASSDEMLVARIAAGDRLAMQTLFARHRTAIYRWLLRFVGNETVAEDLLSDVFLDVWRQAGRFEGRSAVATWLLSIARFKALSTRRRQTHAELDETIEATVADPTDDPEVLLEKKNRDELMREALTKLSPEHREIIDLVYYHEKSVEECAQILAIPAATVKTRMFYARKKLAELVYAATIHKSQGSEYPAVIIPMLTQHYDMLQRHLLYTGVTRGKRLVVLVGQKKAVAIAVRNISGRRRWSKLGEWLRPGTPRSRQIGMAG